MPRPDRFRKAVVELLRQEGKPLHYTEVGRRLKEMGLWAQVREPEKIAKVRLAALARWHRSQVVALGEGLYALREAGDTTPEP
ncbi:HTH domain-containing protein [Thermus caliditerrae]|uniref:HTH domain-containing protein n=1 Tax=Thermus caliditerrae TaxID=1330700 RepID=UPI000570F9A5|nr:HTH domain-containing protein [Thermus caliditerrae]